ncbi:hypothetical protein [Streptomyces sp. NPDC006668]|uniref:hypothetical protein n=1 Tax=Streptomyces sp. NPDC006668 TaxID=3156903 RepID=UPI003408CF17
MKTAAVEDEVLYLITNLRFIEPYWVLYRITATIFPRVSFDVGNAIGDTSHCNVVPRGCVYILAHVSVFRATGSLVTPSKPEGVGYVPRDGRNAY